MELKEFIGKVVISAQTKRRFRLYEITSPQIIVVTTTPNSHGNYSYYSWETVNGDPLSNGYLAFEDATLLEPFKAAYNAYCHTKDARLESYHYWLMKE